MAQIDLGASQSLTVTGTGTGVSTRNEISGTISGTGTSGLNKAGTGTLLLSNATLSKSDYIGPTTLLQGRLQLGAADQIPDGSTLVLSGGVFDTGGFSDTVGALSLAGTVTIDFGLSNSVFLLFGDSHSQLWNAGTLNIINFTPGADFLRFGSDSNGLTADQLAQISFNGAQASIDSAGFVQPVPESGTASVMLMALGFVVGGSRLRKRDAAV
jgi:autotransporter-associated beta strand protein